MQVPIPDVSLLRRALTAIILLAVLGTTVSHMMVSFDAGKAESNLTHSRLHYFAEIWPLSLVFFPVLYCAIQGPVASVFWLDDALESALRLDAIVTLVDAKNITRQLRRGPDGESGEGELGGGGQGQEERRQGPRNEAAMQVAYADRILVNKVCMP